MYVQCPKNFSETERFSDFKNFTQHSNANSRSKILFSSSNFISTPKYGQNTFSTLLRGYINTVDRNGKPLRTRWFPDARRPRFTPSQMRERSERNHNN